jgi:hypothetical protein
VAPQDEGHISQDVDGRDESGHDEAGVIPGLRSRARDP